MTNEERDIISQFIARVGGAPMPGQQQGYGGSVPATQAALPAGVELAYDGLVVPLV